jgi:hypothetical protein
VIDGKGVVYAADRDNQRIQVFDADGVFQREFKGSGDALRPGTYRGGTLGLGHGHAGRVLKLNLDGQIPGGMSRQGRAR